MLVLTRTAVGGADAIHIGDNVVIRILGVNGDKVKIGFDAPKEIPIMRGEIYGGERNADNGVHRGECPEGMEDSIEEDGRR